VTGTSRADVALRIVNSQEGLTRVVIGAYGSLLGRKPEAAGLATWTTALAHGLTSSQLMAKIAASQEYIAHAASNGGVATTDCTTSAPVMDSSASDPGASIDLGSYIAAYDSGNDISTSTDVGSYTAPDDSGNYNLNYDSGTDTSMTDPG